MNQQNDRFSYIINPKLRALTVNKISLDMPLNHLPGIQMSHSTNLTNMISCITSPRYVLYLILYNIYYSMPVNNSFFIFNIASFENIKLQQLN